MRKSPDEIVRLLMEALESEPKTIDALANEIRSSWATVWKYLELIDWIQSCPRVGRIPAGKRMELWRREWGKLPR
ncbi:MAG: hypothetical protein OEZ44_11035 [Candidatus Bathyarchaeota archaeon]|nr:hypothetical protein [Candidatus Bathyarchaeota archaeon]